MLAWLVGVVVLAAVGIGMWRVFPGRSRRLRRSAYPEALEAWIRGDLDAAEALLRQTVIEDADSVDPFLQLGNLLRLRGDAARAAVLHRGLTLRAELPRARKVEAALALVEDLIALKQWSDASATLDTVARDLGNDPRLPKARFEIEFGRGNLPDAARALKHARKHVPPKDRPWFQAAYAAFQLDRALGHALAGEETLAQPRLKDVAAVEGATARADLVRALLAARRGDASAALALAAEKLLDNPDELAVLLPELQEVLLASGQYQRAIPLLESACREENAPASLWIHLALLYEKLGRRDETLRLIESKSGRAELRPDVAAPLLRLLLKEAEGTDAQKVWKHLDSSSRRPTWRCTECGRRSPHVRWFCPACRSFDSYISAPAEGGR